MALEKESRVIQLFANKHGGHIPDNLNLRACSSSRSMGCKIK